MEKVYSSKLSVNDPFVVDMKRKREECIQNYINSGVEETWAPIVIPGHDFSSYKISNLSNIMKVWEDDYGMTQKRKILPQLRVSRKTMTIYWVYCLFDEQSHTYFQYGLLSLLGNHFIELIGYSKSYFQFTNKKTAWDTTAFNISILPAEERTNRKIQKKTLHQICVYLEANCGSTTEIAKRCGVSVATVNAIVHKKRYTDISKYYNIDNYQGKSRRFSDGRDIFPTPSEEEVGALLSYFRN